MFIKAIRGAVQVKQDDTLEIDNAVRELINGIRKKNDLEEHEIVYIHFSQTKDLKTRNPATALRTIGFSETPLFCCQEPEIENSLPRIIRVLIVAQLLEERNMDHLYIGGAEKLRPEYGLNGTKNQ